MDDVTDPAAPGCGSAAEWGRRKEGNPCHPPGLGAVGWPTVRRVPQGVRHAD